MERGKGVVINIMHDVYSHMMSNRSRGLPTNAMPSDFGNSNDYSASLGQYDPFEHQPRYTGKIAPVKKIVIGSKERHTYQGIKEQFKALYDDCKLVFPSIVSMKSELSHEPFIQRADEFLNLLKIILESKKIFYKVKQSEEGRL